MTGEHCDVYRRCRLDIFNTRPMVYTPASPCGHIHASNELITGQRTGHNEAVVPLQGGGTDPWETGSYDLALEEARIEDFNIVAYTSVVPPEATEVPPMSPVSGACLCLLSL